ncbi:MULTISPECIES: PsbP-related protein [unclassified Methanoregula]|uniref:PsbP-related protein n=1 Tax=unclassified Methanoregula TaxID=2649730 RepID=UPI0009D5DA80|nr:MULTISPECIES: PsbP-related protein [unclassified Methanoregula]OPX62524.1 MAG: hypothetical protein A4E33_02273 [Methanoregula sp. PtaB.Bin085]OPY31623.1 MAG: hypothetical protein A4E34_02816 [Methanoregula sp. PtaU1.Bin006]
MKNSLILILLIAVLLVAGCTGQNPSPATPAPTAVPATHTIPPTARTTIPPAPLVTETAQSTFIVTSVPAATATAPSAAGGPAKTYTNKEFGFAFDMPAGWTTEGEWVTTAGGYEKKYKIYFDEPMKSALQYVTITGGASGLNLEDFYNIYMKQYQADPEVSIVSQESVQMDGTPAKKLVMIRGTGENALESIIIMTIKGNNAYFFEFTTRKGQFATYAPATEKVLDTIQFI